MHGTNPIRKQDLSNGQALQVQEIFLTLQGEGPFVGSPAAFIRLSGCNLACHFCDTDFESAADAPPLTPKEILLRIWRLGSHPPPLVVLTGGEPLRQEIGPLCCLLIAARFHVQIETAGTIWVPSLAALLVHPPHAPDSLDPGLSIVVSPKTGKIHEAVRTHARAWKYIIDAEDEIDLADGLPNSSTQIVGQKQRIARPDPTLPRHRIFVQPCDRGDEEKNKRNTKLATDLALTHGFRLSLQQHKIIGLP